MLSEDSLDLILGELKNGWYHKWLDELFKGILIWLTLVLVLGSLELSEENNGWSLNSLGLGASLILNVNESNFILRDGIWEMSLSVKGTLTLSEISNDELVVLDGLGESIAISRLRWWARLLGNP